MQVKNKLRQLSDNLNIALLNHKTNNLLQSLETPSRSLSSTDVPLLRDRLSINIRSFGNFFEYIKNSLNFLEDKQEVECDLEKLIKQFENQHQYSENTIKKMFSRSIQQQQTIIDQRRKSLQADYDQNNLIESLESFSVLVQNRQNKTLNFKIEGSKKELIELKEGKIVPSIFIINFFKILKFGKKIGDNIQIASLKFLPSVLKNIGESTTDSKLFKTIKLNFDFSIKYLQNFILSKEITVIPFLTGQHYSMIIVKKINLISLQIIYCSSRYTLDRTLMKAIAMYLKIEMEKNPNLPKIFDKNISNFQLLLPKQVRSQDSGLYLMLYCEILLTTKSELEKLDLIPNRNKLHLFPRSLALSMRQRVWNFYKILIDPSKQDKFKILQDYFEQRKSYNLKAIFKLDFDQLQKKEVSKLVNLLGSDSEKEEERYALELQYYYNKIVNYYEQ